MRRSSGAKTHVRKQSPVPRTLRKPLVVWSALKCCSTKRRMLQLWVSQLQECLWQEQDLAYQIIYVLHYIGLAWSFTHWVMDGAQLWSDAQRGGGVWGGWGGKKLAGTARPWLGHVISRGTITCLRGRAPTIDESTHHSPYTWVPSDNMTYPTCLIRGLVAHVCSYSDMT